MKLLIGFLTRGMMSFFFWLSRWRDMNVVVLSGLSNPLRISYRSSHSLPSVLNRKSMLRLNCYMVDIYIYVQSTGFSVSLAELKNSDRQMAIDQLHLHSENMDLHRSENTLISVYCEPPQLKHGSRRQFPKWMVWGNGRPEN
jgi:hypothetical protein